MVINGIINFNVSGALEYIIKTKAMTIEKVNDSITELGIFFINSNLIDSSLNLFKYPFNFILKKFSREKIRICRIADTISAAELLISCPNFTSESPKFNAYFLFILIEVKYRTIPIKLTKSVAFKLIVNMSS